MNDGDIDDPRATDGLPLSRSVPRNLDQLEKWAADRAEIARRLVHQPDEDGGASALGISPASQELVKTIRKSSHALPGDSWAGSTYTLAECLMKQQETRHEAGDTGPLPWYMRSRR